MTTLFKNPWTWLLVLFIVLVAMTGWFLFGEKSAMVVERKAEDFGKEIKQEKLSEEISDEIVKQLEEGNGVPEERMENEELGMGNGERPTTDNEQGAMNSEQLATDNRQPTTKEDQGGEESVSNGEDQTANIQNTAAVVNRLASWGFAEASEREIDTIVIHSTYNALGGDPFSVEKIISIYKSYGVAPHYLVARDGTVYRLVEEKNTAYHAGDSRMPDGRTNVNVFSIGIEVIGKDDGSPSDEQYTALKKLLADIKSRNAIKYIVGHSDIASGRKTDPWGFEWKEIGGKDL